MILQKLVVGQYQTNCYLVQAQKGGDIVVIDPGGDEEEIESAVQKLDAKVKYIVNTHGHCDHISANVAIKKIYGAKILIHPSDAPYLLDEEKNLSKSMKIQCQTAFADFPIKDGTEIKVDDLAFKVIHTPGHTPGSVCLYQPKEKILFSGDTLFKDGVGKVEVGLSKKDLQESLKKLFELPQDVKVYPGHGEETTIGKEKQMLETSTSFQ